MFALDRLRALDALATQGSVAGAAGALHLTPSAVSQQLAKPAVRTFRAVAAERDGAQAGSPGRTNPVS